MALARNLSPPVHRRLRVDDACNISNLRMLCSFCLCQGNASASANLHNEQRTNSVLQAMVERAAKEFPCQSQKLYISILNGTLWVDHSLTKWPPGGWYPAELGGGVVLYAPNDCVKILMSQAFFMSVQMQCLALPGCTAHWQRIQQCKFGGSFCRSRCDRFCRRR